MGIPMHLCQSQLLLYQRNMCFPEATLILISRRQSRSNVPRSGCPPIRERQGGGGGGGGSVSNLEDIGKIAKYQAKPQNKIL